MFFRKSEKVPAPAPEVPVRPDEIPPANATDHWDRNAALVESRVLKGWLDWDFIEEEHIRPLISGDRNVYYLQHFFRTHLPPLPVDRALSLGCGGGNLERALVSLNAARRIDGFDASPESIRLAEELAEKEGMGERLRYAIADVNRIELPPKTYDFVIAKMSLHHLADFDAVYSQVARSLKPRGVFVFNEYVGPTRFQWTADQLRIANEVLKVLPKELRMSSLIGAELLEIGRPTIEEMIRMDPSEAVRSEEIIPALTRHFDVVERKDYGGTLLHLLLNHVMPSFDVTNELHASLLRMIFLFERTLFQSGVLASDHAYVVARPKPR